MLTHEQAEAWSLYSAVYQFTIISDFKMLKKIDPLSVQYFLLGYSSGNVYFYRRALENLGTS